MQYLIVVAPGDDITSFPHGEIAIRASSYMTAARGTLTTASDSDASSGDYVADAQTIALANFTSWSSTSPYTNTSLVDLTLEIPLQDLVDAGMEPNPTIYVLYASLKWPGEAAGDGMRDGAFFRHSSFITSAYATAVSPMVISSGGESTYDSLRTHYSVKRLAAAIRYFTGPGEDPIADGRLQITLASRETEIGTIVPRIDQLMLIPFDTFSPIDADNYPTDDENAFRVEAGVKLDADLNGRYTVDDKILGTDPVLDYQEADDSDDAEFTAEAVEWSGGSDPKVDVWMIAGISNREARVEASDAFGRTTDFGGSWSQVLGSTETGSQWWTETSRQGNSQDNNIGALYGAGAGGYKLDGSQLLDLMASSYFEPPFGESTASDLYAALGGTTVFDASETFGTYNYQRPRARSWSDARDWDVTCRVQWDKIPQTTYQNGIVLTNAFNVGFIASAKLIAHLSWCAEMDETGTTYGRMRFNHPGTQSGYPDTTFPPDNPPAFGDPDAPDNNYLNVLSEVIGEVEFEHDLGDWIWLRFQRIGYRLRGKIWLDGDTEPGTWDVDKYLLRAERDGGGVYYIIDYPYIPTAGDRTLQQSRFNVDFQCPGITTFVETWNSYMYEAYGGAADPPTFCADPFWQHVGWPQDVCDYITSGLDDFEVSYPNEGDPVDCFIRCYNMAGTAITDTMTLPKGAQYLGYVGRFAYKDYDDTTQMEGALFKYKTWNDAGAPPLQAVLTKFPRGLRFNLVLHGTITWP